MELTIFLICQRHLEKQLWKVLNLKANYGKNKTSVANLKSHKKQKNFCSKLYKKERKGYYERLDLNNVTDNKKIIENCKTIFV